MKKLKIKVSGIKTMTKHQIEWTPYDSDDLIANAIVNVMTLDYLDILESEGRIEVVNETDDEKEYVYTYG
mgnify:CR=1 FL=1|tara:strand:- start:3499 stop:3708 length:210 start_codon:yes stop_codon:yes gene_type:complete